MALDILVDDLRRIQDLRIGTAKLASRMSGRRLALQLPRGRRTLRWMVDGQAFKVMLEGDLNRSALHLTPRQPYLIATKEATVRWLIPALDDRKPLAHRSRRDGEYQIPDPCYNWGWSDYFPTEERREPTLSLR